MSANQLLYAPILCLLGLFAGSLTNTVAYRWPRGIHPLHPPGFCPHCNTTLAFPDSIPLLGYALLKGKCKHCRFPIHPLYPLTELATAVLYVATGLGLANAPLHPLQKTLLITVTLAFISTMILIALIDYRHHVIPDLATTAGTITALAVAPILPQLHHAQNRETFALHHPYLSHLLPGQQSWQLAIAAAVVGAAAGAILSLLILAAGNILFKNRLQKINADSSMGIGDVKLMIFIGAFLGWKSVPLTYAVASVIGAVAGSLLKLHSGASENKTGWKALQQKWRNGISIIPLGPFLAIGAITYLFANEILEKLLGLVP